MGIYEPKKCCLASVKILEESCRAVAGSNAPKRHISLQRFLSSLALQGCQSIGKKSVRKLIVFMHYIGM